MHRAISGHFEIEVNVVSSSRTDSGPGHWHTLAVGDLIELFSNGISVHQGVVDARTSDGSIVWVTSTFGRRLFHQDDEFELVIKKRHQGTPDLSLDFSSTS